MQWFRLATILGMSVRRAQMEVDAREFAEWQAVERILGPLDISRFDILAAIIAGAATNAQRGREDRVHPKEFIPQFGTEEPERKKVPLDDKVNLIMTKMAAKWRQ